MRVWRLVFYEKISFIFKHAESLFSFGGKDSVSSISNTVFFVSFQHTDGGICTRSGY